MSKGSITKIRDDLYVVRIIIWGRLYEYEVPSKKAAKELLEKLIRENPDL